MTEPCAFVMPAHKAGYVEIAKVASSSIKEFVASELGIPLDGGDPHATELPAVPLVDLPADWFVFAFVRDPWDRLVSCYRDKVGGEPGELTHLEGRGVAACLSAFEVFYAGMPFAEFVSAVAEIPDEQADEHFRSQHTFLSHRVDFVGRFERLDADFLEVVTRLGIRGRLGHRQASASRSDYHRFYTPTTSRIVARRYAKDIQDFGYQL